MGKHVRDTVILSITHTPIHSPPQPRTQPPTRPLLHPLVHPCTHSFNSSPMYSLAHLSFIERFTRSSIHAVTHSFNSFMNVPHITPHSRNSFTHSRTHDAHTHSCIRPPAHSTIQCISQLSSHTPSHTNKQSFKHPADHSLPATGCAPHQHSVANVIIDNVITYVCCVSSGPAIFEQNSRHPTSPMLHGGAF